MKLNAHHNSLQTNQQSETQNFGIGDLSVIIGILRNHMYEHKVRTLVQEYLSNARDAVVEAGKKGHEFEITIPNRLNPVFKVRDYGIGITPDRMAKVFILYGASTKRNDNGQIGGFGLGAKAGFSYTDSFTITTFVDGIKRTYIAHLGTQHQGQLDHVGTEETTESNGTEIQIAVKPNDVEEFRNAAFRATHFWAKKPTFKGESEIPVLEKGYIVSDLIEIVDRTKLPQYLEVDSGHSYYGNCCVAVIGGIPYKLNLHEKVKSLGYLKGMVNKCLILHFGNGVVEVAASRESIADSKHTVDALEKLAQKALLEVKTHIAEAFGKVKSTAEYLKTYHELSPYLDVGKYSQYGTYTINSGHIESDLLKKVKLTVVHCLDRRGRRRIDKITKDDITGGSIPVEHLDKLFFVDTQENKIVQGKRIREYLQTNDKMYLVHMLNTCTPKLDAQGSPVKDASGTPQVDRASYPAEFQQVIQELGAADFTSITYVDLPKATGPTQAKVKRDNAQICLHKARGETHEYTTLATNTQKWIYVTLDVGKWPEKFSKDAMKELASYGEENGFNVCGLAEHGVKTVKGDANFIPIEKWLADFTPSKDELSVAKSLGAKNYSPIETLKSIKQLDDPFLNEMITEYRKLGKTSSRLPNVLLTKMAALDEVKEFKAKDKQLNDAVESEYRLLDIGSYSLYRDELAFYLNAKYNSKNSNKK